MRSRQRPWEISWLRPTRSRPQLCSWNIYSSVSYCFSLSVFEEPEDPSNRSFFSEIISSISDVKFSHSGRYLMTRDYLTVKVWDVNMESKPLETYQVLALQIRPWPKTTVIMGLWWRHKQVLSFSVKYSARYWSSVLSLLPLTGSWLP